MTFRSGDTRLFWVKKNNRGDPYQKIEKKLFLSKTDVKQLF